MTIRADITITPKKDITEQGPVQFPTVDARVEDDVVVLDFYDPMRTVHIKREDIERLLILADIM